MPRQQKLRPKTHIPGLPESLYDLDAFSEFDYQQELEEDRQEQRVFRVKRKHVLKACDRCRVKKTKALDTYSNQCDGKQPCNRCSAYNYPCLFREKKATQAKVYSRGFVEMLESHHSLVVKALQKLYKNCVNNEGFPGEPLTESANGHPLTHEILDRLGLIRQAEETDEPDEESEDLQYLKSLSTSTESSATTDPSPEPITPPEPSSSNCSPIDPPLDGLTPSKWGFPLFPPATQTDQFHDYSDPNYQQQTMMMSRQALGTAASLGGDAPPSSCHGNVPLHSGIANHHNIPYWYYNAGGCNEEDLVKAHNIYPPMMTGLSPHQTAAGLPVDMLNNYHLPFQEQQQQQPQALYSATSLAPGWTFPPSG